MVMAFAEARAGQFDSAFARYDEVLSMPAQISVQLLQELDLPDEFKQDPRFAALIERGDKVF